MSIEWKQSGDPEKWQKTLAELAPKHGKKFGYQKHYERFVAELMKDVGDVHREHTMEVYKCEGRDSLDFLRGGKKTMDALEKELDLHKEGETKHNEVINQLRNSWHFLSDYASDFYYDKDQPWMKEEGWQSKTHDGKPVPSLDKVFEELDIRWSKGGDPEKWKKWLKEVEPNYGDHFKWLHRRLARGLLKDHGDEEREWVVQVYKGQGDDALWGRPRSIPFDEKQMRKFAAKKAKVEAEEKMDLVTVALYNAWMAKLRNHWGYLAKYSELPGLQRGKTSWKERPGFQHCTIANGGRRGGQVESLTEIFKEMGLEGKTEYKKDKSTTPEKVLKWLQDIQPNYGIFFDEQHRMLARVMLADITEDERWYITGVFNGTDEDDSLMPPDCVKVFEPKLAEALKKKAELEAKNDPHVDLVPIESQINLWYTKLRNHWTYVTRYAKRTATPY
eukprot:jgi/Bigna1/68840/fgenesh1_pg.7_\